MAVAPLDSLEKALDGATVLVTGGAGFIGSALCTELVRAVPGARVIALDNLRRSGSELNVTRLRSAGVRFVHGDVRVVSDLDSIEGHLRLIIDCAADPSVLGGYLTSPVSVTGPNLVGTLNCLELARRTSADVIFLSTSRVYPIAALNRISTLERETRYSINPSQSQAGVSVEGVNEEFSLEGVRSLYGATKLASELLLQEYAAACGFRYVVNRLGVVTGRGQMGRVEQGVFSMWMAQHYFGGELAYRGWGGAGKQVRDLMHVQDVWQLVKRQITQWERVNGQTYNVGGGSGNAISLLETTQLCQELAGRAIPVRSHPETHPSDVRLYCTDFRKVTADTGWMPTWTTRRIFEDLLSWFREEEASLRSIFCN